MPQLHKLLGSIVILQRRGTRITARLIPIAYNVFAVGLVRFIPCEIASVDGNTITLK